MIKIDKCPFCGSSEVGSVKAKDGETFAVPTINKTTGQVTNYSMLPLMFVCSTCKSVWFNNPNFKGDLSKEFTPASKD